MGNFFDRDIPKIHEAIGTKLALFIYYSSNSVICIITALVAGWQLTLVVLVVTPVSLIVSAVVEVILSDLSAKHQAQFSKCGIILQQTVVNIKTVMAFNGQRKQTDQFASALDPAHEVERKHQMVSAFGLGISWLLKYCSYALSIWFATRLFFDDVEKVCSLGRVYDTKAVMIVSRHFLLILMIF